MVLAEAVHDRASMRAGGYSSTRTKKPRTRRHRQRRFKLVESHIELSVGAIVGELASRRRRTANPDAGLRRSGACRSVSYSKVEELDEQNPAFGLSFLRLQRPAVPEHRDAAAAVGEQTASAQRRVRLRSGAQGGQTAVPLPLRDLLPIHRRRRRTPLFSPEGLPIAGDGAVERGYRSSHRLPGSEPRAPRRRPVTPVCRRQARRRDVGEIRGERRCGWPIRIRSGSRSRSSPTPDPASGLARAAIDVRKFTLDESIGALPGAIAESRPRCTRSGRWTTIRVPPGRARPAGGGSAAS